MTTWKYNLKIDADLPGVVTTVTQSVDFSKLDPTQLRRVVRAVERGHTARGGYVAGLVQAAAKHLGVTPPIEVSSYYVAPLDKDKYGAAFADLIKVSDVRYQLHLAQQPSRQQSPYYTQRKSGWMETYSPKSLYLWGFQNDVGALKREVEKVLRTTDYYTDLKRLAEFIKTAPTFEVK